MAGKDPEEAVDNYVEPIRRLIGAFATGVTVRADSTTPSRAGVLNVEPTPVALRVPRRGHPSLSLTLTQHYRIVQDDDPVRGPWKVRIDAWSYVLNRAGKPFVGYHWHPNGISHVTYPHLHAYASDVMKHRHVPTGRVMIEDVFELALELGAQPLVKRADRLFAKNRAAFRRGATWGVGPR